MARRRKSSSLGSLELLLDTICNTFGGIILIALLVVILISTTSESSSKEPATRESQAALIQKENQRKKLTAELEKLVQADREAKANMSEVSPEAIALAKKLKELKDLIARMRIENSKTVGQINQTESDINTTLTDVKNAEEELIKTRKLNTELVKRLDVAKKNHSEEISVDKVAVSTLEQRYFFVKYGKFFGPAFTGIVNEGVHNNEEFDFEQKLNLVYIKPKPEKGTIIPDSQSSLDKLKKKIDYISPRQYSIQVFVWPDSFGRFEQVRRIIAELGFEIEPTLMLEDEYPHKSSNVGPRRTQGG